MTHAALEQLVKEAVARIPAKFRQLLTNVVFVVEDEPSVEALREMNIPPGDTLLGMHEGIPHGFREGALWYVPNRIVIFKKPVEAEAREARRAVRDVVYDTVWHEVAHFLGMEENEVRRAEDKQGRRARRIQKGR